MHRRPFGYLAPQRRFDGRAVDALDPDHDNPPAPLFAGLPRPVVLVRDPRADSLNEQAHRLPGHGDVTLHSQHVGRLGRPHHPRGECPRVRHLRHLDDERLEIVVVVIRLVVVMRWRRREIILRRSRKPSSTLAGTRPSRVATILIARGTLRLISSEIGAARLRRHQIGLVEHDEIGAEKLILVDFFQRVVVIDGGIRRALRRDFRRVVGERPALTAGPSTTVTTPSTVTRLRISGHSKAFTSGFGNAKPDVSTMMCSGGGLRASSASSAGTKSSATVQHRQPFVSSMIFSSGQFSIAARAQNRAVDADIAELIDDERQAPAFAHSRSYAARASSFRRREIP